MPLHCQLCGPPGCAVKKLHTHSTRKSRPFYTLLHVVPQKTVLWMQTDWCTAPRIHAVHRMLQQNTQLKKRLIITTRYTKNNLWAYQPRLLSLSIATLYVKIVNYTLLDSLHALHHWWDEMRKCYFLLLHSEQTLGGSPLSRRSNIVHMGRK